MAQDGGEEGKEYGEIKIVGRDSSFGVIKDLIGNGERELRRELFVICRM